MEARQQVLQRAVDKTQSKPHGELDKALTKAGELEMALAQALTQVDQLGLDVQRLEVLTQALTHSRQRSQSETQESFLWRDSM